MLKFKFIAIGGGANKAAIELLSSGIIDESQLVLLNSTIRDIPANYKHLSHSFSDDDRGCGKERTKAKRMIVSAIQNGSLDFLNDFITPEDDGCMIITTSEGGSGSGASAILAKYVKEVLNIKTHIFIFTGFENDGRSLQNTIELLQELDDDYSMHVISNKKYLEGGSNYINAEHKANIELVKRVSILIGYDIVDSNQNIDDYDLVKVSNTSGYMDIGECSLDGIKNLDQFNKLVVNMLDDLKSLEVSEKSVKRLAVFLNIADRTKDFIDFKFSAIRNRFGEPFEIYTHIQSEPDQGEHISFIASGMQMPINEVKDIYEKYKTASKSVNKTKDMFFKEVGEFEGYSEDRIFDFDKSPTVSKNKDEFINSITGNKSINKEQGSNIQEF